MDVIVSVNPEVDPIQLLIDMVGIGFKPHRSLLGGAIFTGTIADEPLDSLSRLPGVTGVEPDRGVTAQ